MFTKGVKLNNSSEVKTIFDHSKECSQVEFSRMIGVSEATVSGLVSRGVISIGQSLEEWNKQYCSQIREQAAGRATNGDIDLATERALLAKEQRIRIEMQNAVTKREYGPIEAMEMGVTNAMVKVVSKLDTIPGQLKKRSDVLTADDLGIVSRVIANIRNDIADMDIDWFGDVDDQDDDIQ